MRLVDDTMELRSRHTNVTSFLQLRCSALNISKRMEAAANVCSPTTAVDIWGRESGQIGIGAGQKNPTSPEPTIPFRFALGEQRV